MGWYAGALVFWLLAAWLITVGLSSIIPQIFWPAGDLARDDSSRAGETTRVDGSCRQALRALRHELLTRVTTRLSASSAPDEGDRDALLDWFEQWDKRLAQAEPGCTDPERDAVVELGRIRHAMQSLVERFEREEAPRLLRLEQLLGAEASGAESGRSKQAQEARADLSRKTTQHE